MYTEFFGLAAKPFAIEPDPRFLVMMEGHSEALATMVYAIDQQEGWALIIGDPGVGKTTLIMALLREVGERVLSAVVTNPRLEPLDFFNQVALELGMDGPYPSKGPFLTALGQLINRCRSQGKLVLIVVDEAQDLAPELMEEIRLLGNLDASSPRALNIFLVGQPEVIRMMKRAGATALMQRLRRNYALKSLTPEETALYVRERLTAAGARRELFDSDALAAVHEVTGGNPRLINSLCDDALLLGFSREKNRVDRELVLAAAAEDPSLDWQPPHSGAPAAPAASPSVRASAPASEPPAREAELLFRSEMGGPGPARPSAPPPRPQPAQPAPQQPPRPVRPASSASPAAEPEAKPVPAAKTAGKRGLFSRMAGSMSKDAPGSLWKRLLLLVLVAALLWGGYRALKANWRRIAPVIGLGQQIIIPEAPSLPGQGPKPTDKLAPDWGPLITPAPSQAPTGQTGEPRG